MLTQKRNILWGIGLVVVAVVGFLVYRTTSTTPAVSNISSSGVESQATGQDILDLLNTFQSVSIDPTFFSNPVFQNLRNYAITVPVENAGRSNPFAPLGGSVVVQSVSTPPKTKK